MIQHICLGFIHVAGVSYVATKYAIVLLLGLRGYSQLPPTSLRCNYYVIIVRSLRSWCGGHTSLRLTEAPRPMKRCSISLHTAFLWSYLVIYIFGRHYVTSIKTATAAVQFCSPMVSNLGRDNSSSVWEWGASQVIIAHRSSLHTDRHYTQVIITHRLSYSHIIITHRWSLHTRQWLSKQNVIEKNYFRKWTRNFNTLHYIIICLPNFK